MASRIGTVGQQKLNSSHTAKASALAHGCCPSHWQPVQFLLPCLSFRRRTGSALQASEGEVTSPVAAVSVAAAISAVVVPPAAAELYKALQPKRCQCCIGTGFVICSTCQGRGKQGLTLPGEPVSHSACPTCLRKGRCPCTECDGSGLENWWLWQPASDPGWGPRGN